MTCPDCGLDVAPVQVSARSTGYYCSCGWSRSLGPPQRRRRRRNKQVTGVVSDAETDEMEEEHLRGLGYLEWPPATGPRGG